VPTTKVELAISVRSNSFTVEIIRDDVSAETYGFLALR
jgi:hypothetical protein